MTGEYAHIITHLCIQETNGQHFILKSLKANTSLIMTDI